MEVTLMGPDDLGYWFLTDDEGNNFPFITRHEDHPNAAAMLGWEQTEGIEDEEAIIMDALDWLNEHTGEEFTAPSHIAAYFDQLYNEQDK